MSELPPLSSVAELNADPALLLVAFASQDGEYVNQHFGSARGFYLYGVSPEGATLLADKQFAKEQQDGNEDKLKPRLSWLNGSDLLYCSSVGGSATKQLLMLGIHPNQVKAAPEFTQIIADLQQQLLGEPSAMLQRVLKKKTSPSSDRFDEMEDEGWDD